MKLVFDIYCELVPVTVTDLNNAVEVWKRIKKVHPVAKLVCIFDDAYIKQERLRLTLGDSLKKSLDKTSLN